MACGQERGTIVVVCGCGTIRKFCKLCWNDWESGPLSEGNSLCEICGNKLREGG